MILFKFKPLNKGHAHNGSIKPSAINGHALIIIVQKFKDICLQRCDSIVQLQPRAGCLLNCTG